MSALATAATNLLEEARAWLGSRRVHFEGIGPWLGDVSPRRYARVHLDPAHTALLAHYPPGTQPMYEKFLSTTQLLTEYEIDVPAVLETDNRHQWMLLEDIGPKTLYEQHLGRHQLEHFLTLAYHTSQRIAAIPQQRVGTVNPPLDGILLRRELELVWEHFLEPLGLRRESGVGSNLEACLDAVCRRLGGAPSVVCHRDFMVRNLIARGSELVVLDHQDLRIGPATYDIASLLNDSVSPPERLLRSLLSHLSAADKQNYLDAVAQRSFKAIGTFARFAAAGYRQHLSLVPETLRRGLAALAAGAAEGAPVSPAAQFLLERSGDMLTK